MVYLPRARVTFGLLGLAAVAAAGCSMNSSVFDSEAYSNAFSKPFKTFDVPAWATGRSNTDIRLGPSGPVAPEDMVSADGRCAPEAAPAVAEAPPNRAPEPDKPPGDRAVGSPAGDLASAPMPTGASPPAPAKPAAARMDRLEPDGPAPAAPAFSGGVALGMTECEVVRRAGAPNSVTIGANEKGERKVVLSYLGGNWPGIYQFRAGRLQEIAAAPTPEKPAKQPRKKPKAKPAKSASGNVNRTFVQ